MIVLGYLRSSIVLKESLPVYLLLLNFCSSSLGLSCRGCVLDGISDSGILPLCAYESCNKVAQVQLGGTGVFGPFRLEAGGATISGGKSSEFGPRSHRSGFGPGIRPSSHCRSARLSICLRRLTHLVVYTLNGCWFHW